MNATTLASRATTALVAAVAGYASFRHIFDVARTAGEHVSVAAVLPLSIDGLILVGTLAMLEDKRDNRKPRLSARLAVAFGVVATLAANIASAQPTTTARLVAAVPPIAFLIAIEVLSRQGRMVTSPTQDPPGAGGFQDGRQVDADPCAAVTTVQVGQVFRGSPENSEDDKGPHSAGTPADDVGSGDPTEGHEVPQFLPLEDPWDYAVPVATVSQAGTVEKVPTPADTLEPVQPKRVTPRSLTAADRVRAAHAKDPAATHERIAHLAGVSVSTVKRHRPSGSPSKPTPAPTRINGHTPELTGVTQ